MEPEVAFVELITGLLLLFLWLTLEKQGSRTTSGCYVVERAESVESGSVRSLSDVLSAVLSHSRANSLLGVLFFSEEAIPRRFHTSSKRATSLSVDLGDCEARTRRLNHKDDRTIATYTNTDRTENGRLNGHKEKAGKRESWLNKDEREVLLVVNAERPGELSDSLIKSLVICLERTSDYGGSEVKNEMKQVKRSRSQISGSGKGEWRSNSADELKRKRKARGQLLLRELEAKQREFLEQTFELPDDMDMYEWIGVFNHLHPGFQVNEVELTVYQDEKKKKRIRCFLADPTKNEEFALSRNESRTGGIKTERREEERGTPSENAHD